MNVVIVEDERPAADRLRAALEAYDPEMHVAAHLMTVAETVAWLSTHREPDLLFLDVRLTDGLSLEIFRKVAVRCPVIFTTAYDAYVLDAFECNSIDYLLKPVKAERLAQALRKYDELRTHFGRDLADRIGQVLGAGNGRDEEVQRRVIVQRGTSYVGLDTDRIRYGFSEEKTTFVVDVDGTRFICDEALTTLEERLDSAAFFRLNRKVIAHIDAVAGFRPAPRGRIRVQLSPPLPEEIVVSQARAARFRSWISG